MKNLLIYTSYILINIIFCNIITNAQETGSIIVNSIPEKASIIINKNLKGIAGDKFDDLIPGIYIIEVTINSIKTDSSNVNHYLKTELQLKASEELFITADFVNNNIVVDKINLNIKTSALKDSKYDPLKDDIFFIVDLMPKYQGGDEAMHQFIAENVVYPQEAIKNKIKGKVYVKFVVTKYGKVDAITIGKSVHPLLDSAAIEVIKKLPDWKPGYLKGKAVNVWFTIPVSFDLATSEK